MSVWSKGISGTLKRRSFASTPKALARGPSGGLDSALSPGPASRPSGRLVSAASLVPASDRSNVCAYPACVLSVLLRLQAVRLPPPRLRRCSMPPESLRPTQLPMVYYLTGMNRLLPLLLCSLTFFCTCDRAQEKTDAVTSTEQNRSPNILWLTCEDISPLLPMFGDSTVETPKVSRLAARGVRFPNTSVFR